MTTSYTFEDEQGRIYRDGKLVYLSPRSTKRAAEHARIATVETDRQRRFRATDGLDA